MRDPSCRRSWLAASCWSLVLPLVAQSPPLSVGPVFPHLTVMAPGAASDSETGIGALVPWADRLWAIGYVAHTRGEGIGLYEIDERLQMKLHPMSVTGTFANRLVHWESKQVFLGPHAIAADGTVRNIEALTRHRLTATARHLRDPAGKVYMLTMEGLLFEVDVATLLCTQLFDLTRELHLPTGAVPHFKGAHTAQGRLVVANNTYDEREYLGHRRGGRLAEWAGGSWMILEEEPFVEVAGKQNPTAGTAYGNTLFAVGWDRASVILRVLHAEQWSRYRLPKGSGSWDHAWTTEWMRIREAQTERYLMDAFGLFYELSPLVYGGRLQGVHPICRHLRIVPDFCHWRGLLVLAGDQTDNAVGQPQSGLWLGEIDALWRFGKPTGEGAVWRDERVLAGVPSDPMLMQGFDRTVLHLTNDGDRPVLVTIEVDVLGDGRFRRYGCYEVTGGGGYVHHEFPAGFAARWVRLVSNGETVLTGHFVFT